MNLWISDMLRGFIGEDTYNTLTSIIDYRLHLSRYYKYHETGTVSPCLVYMADGRVKHGGLADRLRGCVSLYYYSKLVGIDFKAYFISPFLLSDYLIPNKYDWRIECSRLSFDKDRVKAIIIKNNRKDNLGYLKRRLGNELKEKQFHVYTNVVISGIDYKKEFNELFQPSISLKKEIESNKLRIGERYISVTFRFQQALGDFKEGYNKSLSDTEQAELINRCLSFIECVKEKHNDQKKVLVTSDSFKFLQIASRTFDYVYTIPGEVYHIDYINNDKHLAYMKSFVDMFMLSESDYLYTYATGPMYKRSGFAEFAAAIGGRPHIRIQE